MPYYEYRCATNGRTLEVRHGMNERLETWGDLVDRGAADADDTPRGAPVERLISAPVPLTTPSGSASGSTAFQGCGAGCACVPSA